MNCLATDDMLLLVSVLKKKMMSVGYPSHHLVVHGVSPGLGLLSNLNERYNVSRKFSFNFVITMKNMCPC
jgi:hypothetical protein